MSIAPVAAWRCMIVAGTIAIISSCAGCKPATLPEEESRLSKLAVYYGRFIGENKGKSPANEQELKKFIQKIDSEVNVDELFVSPRDKEPYVVFYGKGSSMPGAMTVTVHEKVGVNGKKMVGLSAGQVKTVDEAELKQLLTAK